MYVLTVGIPVMTMSWMNSDVVTSPGALKTSGAAVPRKKFSALCEGVAFGLCRKNTFAFVKVAVPAASWESPCAVIVAFAVAGKLRAPHEVVVGSVVPGECLLVVLLSVLLLQAASNAAAMCVNTGIGRWCMMSPRRTGLDEPSQAPDTPP